MQRYVHIRTPESVEFRYPTAGLGARFAAFVLDMLIVVALMLMLNAATLPLAVFSRGIYLAILFITRFLVFWGYFVALEHFWRGQTLGKRLLGLAVIHEEGVRASFFQIVVRNLFRIVDMAPGLGLVGLVAALSSDTGKRLGDMAAGTVVVAITKRPVPSVVVPPAERLNALLEDRATVERVNHRITLEERELCISLALRRDSLSLAQRAGLFERLGRHLLEKLEADLPDTLSYERFVLNVTAILLERSPWQDVLVENRSGRSSR